MCLLLTLLAAAPGARAANADKSADKNAEKSAAERKQAEVQSRLRQLRTDVRRTESAQAEARDALKAVDAAISDSQRQLHELMQQQARVSDRLSRIEQERALTLTRSNDEHQRLAQWVRAQYFAGRRDPVQTLLLGGNPNQIGRDQAYLAYFARAQRDAIAQHRQGINFGDGPEQFAAAMKSQCVVHAIHGQAVQIAGDTHQIMVQQRGDVDDARHLGRDQGGDVGFASDPGSAPAKLQIAPDGSAEQG